MSDGTSATITVYEVDAGGALEEVDTFQMTLEKGVGEQKGSWTYDSQSAQNDLDNDKKQGETGPLEYVFKVDAGGAFTETVSNKLYFVADITAKVLDEYDEPLPDGAEIHLRDPFGAQHIAYSEASGVTFPGIVYGPTRITIAQLPPEKESGESAHV